MTSVRSLSVSRLWSAFMSVFAQLLDAWAPQREELFRATLPDRQEFTDSHVQITDNLNVIRVLLDSDSGQPRWRTVTLRDGLIDVDGRSLDAPFFQEHRWNDAVCQGHEVRYTNGKVVPWQIVLAIAWCLPLQRTVWAAKGLFLYSGLENRTSKRFFDRVYVP